MFSFLDTNLYGSDQEGAGRGAQHAQVPQGFVAPPLRPDAVNAERGGGSDATNTYAMAQPAPKAPVAPSPPCLDAQSLAVMMDTLQARMVSAEKRTALMEQRLVTALDGCQSRRPPAQTGCTWSLFALTVAAFLAALFFVRRSASLPSPASGGGISQSSVPFVVPAGSLPASPQMVLPLGHAPPTTFVSAPPA